MPAMSHCRETAASGVPKARSESEASITGARARTIPRYGDGACLIREQVGPCDASESGTADALWRTVALVAGCGSTVAKPEHSGMKPAIGAHIRLGVMAAEMLILHDAGSQNRQQAREVQVITCI